MMSFKPDLEIFKDRALSIDLFRGVVMFLLIGKATGFYDLLMAPEFEGTPLHGLGIQFQHHPWEGLRLWDLGQPFFMFISGAAMVFSYRRRWERGEAWKATFKRAFSRAFLLFVFGWALNFINPMEPGFKGILFSDILPQLALGSLVAFLLLKSPTPVQLGFMVGLIALTEILYRSWPVLGFDLPFSPGHNFGSYVDSVLFGQLSAEHWVSFNIVPAAAHVLLGVVAGELLRSNATHAKKMRMLVASGLFGLTLGLALNPWTPIIKRINSSSFMFISGGLALLALALAFLLTDICKKRKGMLFFLVVAMNPIFIYLFATSGGGDWLNSITSPFALSFSVWIGEGPAQILNSLSVWGSMWAFCYCLYRRKIVLKV